MTHRGMALSLLAPLLAVACSFSQPMPSQRSTSLLEARPLGHGPGCGTVRVRRVRVNPLFERRAFVLRTGENTWDVDPYRDFAMPPGQLLHLLTRSWIERAGLFAFVLAPGDMGRADAVLVAEVDSLYVDRRAGEPAAAVFEAEFRLLEPQTLEIGFRSPQAARVPLSGGDVETAVGAAVRIGLEGLERDLRAEIARRGLCADGGDSPEAPAADGALGAPS